MRRKADLLLGHGKGKDSSEENYDFCLRGEGKVRGGGWKTAEDTGYKLLSIYIIT